MYTSQFNPPTRIQMKMHFEYKRGEIKCANNEIATLNLPPPPIVRPPTHVKPPTNEDQPCRNTKRIAGQEALWPRN